MIGKTLSHYKILEKIGGGGMGIVYKAEDTKLKRIVALKFLPPAFATDSTTKERFIHEAQAASALQHNNICAIHEIDETDDGQLYIVMDCYEGETLKSKIEKGRLKIEEAVDYTIQIAKGLQKAHEKGIVHRDIKPANVMITEDGVAKILDFGLAKFRGQTKITKSGSTVGTVAYMSPEQARGEEVDHRTDIWSLGVMLYEMVTAELPFKGDYDQAIIYSIINDEPESMGIVPSALKGIIEKTLEKNKDERYQDINQFVSDLKEIIGETDTSRKVISFKNKSKGHGRKKILKYATIPIVIVVTLLVGYLIGQLYSTKDIEPISITVVSFKNETGDATYNYLQKVIPNLLITDLEQSRFFQVNTWERNYDLLEQVGQEDLEYIDSDIGTLISKMDNVTALISGSITKKGDLFSIETKISDTETQQILDIINSSGKGLNSIIRSQIDDIMLQIAVSFNLPKEDIVQSQKPLADVTTNSLEAYKYFILGQEHRDAFRYQEVIENLTKAVIIDSTFAMAHLYLGYAHRYYGTAKEMDNHLRIYNKYRYCRSSKPFGENLYFV
jgi:serine/threonine protein kinase